MIVRMPYQENEIGISLWRSVVGISVAIVGVFAAGMVVVSFKTAMALLKPVITIFMIGDSTMANKSLTGGNPERGWGQMLPGYLSEEIRVDNHAVNGRSSKSFIEEGRWEKVF